MASILESYEKQYGNLTSEITSKLNNISRLANGNYALLLSLQQAHDNDGLDIYYNGGSDICFYSFLRCH